MKLQLSGHRCRVRQFSMFCVSCEDLLVEAKHAMSSSLAKTKSSESDEIQPCRRCLVPAIKPHKMEDALSEMFKKAGLATAYALHCL